MYTADLYMRLKNMLKFTYNVTTYFVGYKYHFKMITETDKEVRFETKDRPFGNCYGRLAFVDAKNEAINNFERGLIYIDGTHVYRPKELVLVRKNVFRKKVGSVEKHFGFNKEDKVEYFGSANIDEVKNERRLKRHNIERIIAKRK